MNELTDLYESVIMAHARQPHNSYEMTDACYTGKGINPLCGDQVNLFLKLKDNLIEEVSAVARGCAICKASASLMTDALRGKTIEQATILKQNLLAALKGQQDIESTSELSPLNGIKKFPVRIKCATLAWYAVEAAINENPELVSSE